MKRNNGFILLELLLALTISAVALTLFWIATNNRMQMLTKIEENYSYARLMSDYEILRDANHKINFDASHYKPLKFIITKHKIQILSQNTIINEISK